MSYRSFIVVLYDLLPYLRSIHLSGPQAQNRVRHVVVKYHDVMDSFKQANRQLESLQDALKKREEVDMVLYLYHLGAKYINLFIIHGAPCLSQAKVRHKGLSFLKTK
jgi:hypothetical protein